MTAGGRNDAERGRHDAPAEMDLGIAGHRERRDGKGVTRADADHRPSFADGLIDHRRLALGGGHQVGEDRIDIHLDIAGGNGLGRQHHPVVFRGVGHGGGVDVGRQGIVGADFNPRKGRPQGIADLKLDDIAFEGHGGGPVFRAFRGGVEFDGGGFDLGNPDKLLNLIGQTLVLEQAKDTADIGDLGPLDLEDQQRPGAGRLIAP
ncbi:MAG: hypothetical protein ACD_75C01697G0004 [uncultured bacterium]|nr:MAG: hypothetical protein ACD_75C01697G0004 [uncultured bacterium]